MTITDTNNEYILCAAIKYGDSIVCGRRHGDCYDILISILKQAIKARLVRDNTFEPNTLDSLDNYPTRNEQGFITSKDRYVDRKEAWTIALAAGQVKDRNWSGEEFCKGLPAQHPNDPMILTSEDLY